MRGENPVSFPIRLFPQGIPVLPAYPTRNPRGFPIEPSERAFHQRLPLFPIPLQGDALEASRLFSESLPAIQAGLSTMALANLIHAGNIVFPATPSTQGDTLADYAKRTVGEALKLVFDKETKEGEARYRAKSVGADWMVEGALAAYSPKFEAFLRRVQQAEGCVFAYTRFISGGALPLALILEANGYSLYGRKRGLLVDGIQAPGGRQCALCPRKEQQHQGASHLFTPAYYGLLTGDTSLSPKNDQTIKAQRGFDNVDGRTMKVIIGSQIASEGVDLRFVRETHVLDSWFHLNKTEQILGRAIRYLSHCALPAEKRNNTVYLYSVFFPEGSGMEDRETADLYSYRLGFKKAAAIGRVTRILKQAAVDCNLNHDAILIAQQDPVRQVDSQRAIREAVDVNDMPFTAVCDWIETCDYTCSPTVDLKSADRIRMLDDSTYDEYSARWRVEKMKRTLRTLFERSPFYTSEDLWNLFSDVPRFIVADFLRSAIQQKAFPLRHGEQTGYLRYCNGYYLFQPSLYADLTIPLSIRVAQFPVKRDHYFPAEADDVEVEEEQKQVDTLSTIDEVWDTLQQWSSELAEHAEFTVLPDVIEQRIQLVSEGDTQRYNHYRYAVDMIQWLHESFHLSGEVDTDAFRRTLLFYFWDEWLTVEEQTHLAFSSPHAQHPSVQECLQEGTYSLGRLLVRRFYQPAHHSVFYACEEGTECTRSIQDAIAKDAADPLHRIVISPQTMGPLYGFLISKNGELVFKTNRPRPDGGVLKGQECGIVSSKAVHMDKLIELGMVLVREGKGDFDLNRTVLLTDAVRAVERPVSICTLMNLVLRLMNEFRVGGKKWFLRPLSAFLAGHPGFFRKGKKKAGIRQ
jgi:hypothetical protein